MVWGVLGQEGKGCGIRRNAVGQPGFHGRELWVVDEVLILMWIILEIIEFLETITVADESVALIGDPV